MPSISKTKNNTFIVQYYDNKKKRNKTFKTKSEAKQFAAMLELGKAGSSTGIKFSELITKYRDTVSVKKAGFKNESVRLNALLRRPIAKLPIAKINRKTLQDYIDWRVSSPSQTGGTVGNATVRREFTDIRVMFNWAVKQGYLKESPAKGVELPPENPHRERIASDEDLKKLRDCCGWDGTSVPTNKAQLVILAFHLACRTGMRGGEILQIEKSWITGNVVRLPKEATKTHASREVALSRSAKQLLDLAIGYGYNQLKKKKIATIPDRIFYPINSKNKIVFFRKIRKKAGLEEVRDSKGRVIKEGLNFHDSRATFTTWAASPDPKTGAPRLDVLTLARQTGHKDLKMLQRYYRATAEEIAERLTMAED